MNIKNACPYCYSEISAGDLLDLELTKFSQSFSCNNCHYVIYFIDINSIGDLVFKTSEDFLLIIEDTILIPFSSDVKEELEEIENIRAIEEDEVIWQ